MKIIRLTIITASLLILIGCSSSGKNPMTPAGEPTGNINASGDVPSYPAASSGGFSGNGVFLLYDLIIDTDTMQAEVIPVRNTAALGDTYVADITSFLYSMCLDCLHIVGVGLTEDDEFLEVTFRLHNPIPTPENLSFPQSGDRIDLHLFDVRGIIYKDGNRSFAGLLSDVNGDGVADETLRCNPGFVKNADGYTTFFDAYMDANVKPTAANLHPYRLFFEDGRAGNYSMELSPVNGWITLSAPQGNNVFPQGDRTDDVTYVFNVGSGGGTIQLNMAFDASYGHSAMFTIPNPEVGSRINPRYFLPEFHRKEAWKAFADVTNNNLAHGDPGSSANLSVTIYDWQAGLLPNGTFDYFESSLNSISAISDCELVEVFLPELMSEPLTEPTSVIGNGSWTEPYVYNFLLNNELDPTGGNYAGIVAIRDSFVNSATPPLGVTRDLEIINITDFTNYQIFYVDIATEPANLAPMPVIITDPETGEVQSGQPISFDATDSYDPDGIITTYQWDFDFDGLGFDIDETGALPPAQIYTNPESVPRMVIVLLKVFDNGTPPMEMITEALVTIQANSPPHAVIEVSPFTTFSECEMVTLDGSSSFDDGLIVSYEWDYDYDPENPVFEVDDTGPVINRRFGPGDHNILLRVSDDTVPALTSITRLQLTSLSLGGAPGDVDFCDNLILNTQDSLNSHSFAGGGQKSAILTATDAVIALWVDEGDVAGGPALRYSISTDGGRSFGDSLVANSNFITGGSSILRPTLVSDQMSILHLGYADGNGDFFYHITNVQGEFSDPIQVGSGEFSYGGPAIIRDGNGDINYFYTGDLSLGKVPLILAQSTDSGSSFDSPITVVPDGRFPSAAMAESSSVVLAFEGNNSALSDSSDIQVAYQRSGTDFYPPIRVVDSPANQGTSTKPVVNIALNGSVHVVWQDSRDGNVDTDYDIYYSYSLSGLSFERNVKVNDTSETPGNQILQDNPAFGMDFMGNVFIAWRDFRDGDGADIFFSYSTMPGSPFRPNIKLNDDTGPHTVAQGPPSIVVSQNSGLLVIWADERNATSDFSTPFTGDSDIFYLFGKLF